MLDLVRDRRYNTETASARLARRKPGDKHDDRKKNRATTQQFHFQVEGGI
tara:strand:+ start:219 stop:368 length:150 start_codon:yes stop_codon:yes gene_type:complete